MYLQGPPVLKTAQLVPSLVWKILTQEDITKLESINLKQAEKFWPLFKAYFSKLIN